MQQDEWRVEVELDDEEGGYSLGERLRARELDDQARERLAGRVLVTRDGSRLFLYAANEEQAHEAERVVRELAAADRLTAEVRTTRWHPDEEAWKDAAVPLPRTDAERAAERASLEQAKQREAEREGEYDWEVHVELPGRGEAAALEQQLEDEGLAVSRRWRYVVVGAPTQDRANELGGRLRDELDDADVWVQPNPEDLPNPLFVMLRSWL